MIDTRILTSLGFTDNEVLIYITLLKTGPTTAYELGKKTGIYRVHIYDKIEQLTQKRLVTHVNRGSKRFFSAAHPSQILNIIENKKKRIDKLEKEVSRILPLPRVVQAPQSNSPITYSEEV